MKHISIKFALFALVIALLATFNTTIQAQSPLDGFDPNANGAIRSIAVQPDGKILIGGNFTQLNPNGTGAVTRSRIARLNADGTVDAAFNPNASGDVYSIAIQADGKILIGGGFFSLNPNNTGSVTRNRIARLNADGTVDASFNPNASSTVLSIAIQADGKILIGGNLTQSADSRVTGLPAYRTIPPLCKRLRFRQPKLSGLSMAPLRSSPASNLSCQLTA